MKRKRKGKGRGWEDIRTDADEGGKEKILWKGGRGEILIWRGKRKRPVVGGFKPL